MPADTTDIDPADDEPQAPRLGKRGRALWTELVHEHTTQATRVLIEEAARTADRLDRLHWACKRDGIIELVDRDGNGDTLTIEIGGAMSEARQQGQALKALLAEIARRADDNPSSGNDDILDGL